eukprot:TRINITY_DN9251_c0_g1_i1.p4 TRINITY_DN9251_c0_g1~~TRINITY_DN9251_c0_g1_i1.p4  ORF type:complete len:52 (+),score=3.99 TRINITY_DN9251_c0_g1_i1:117-272(+)
MVDVCGCQQMVAHHVVARLNQRVIFCGQWGKTKEETTVPAVYHKPVERELA